MKDSSVLSRNLVLTFDKAYPASLIEEGMVDILKNLGDHLNYNGKIMGHLKAIAVSGEHYVQMSLTSLPNINIKTDPDWNNGHYNNLELTINLIIFGYTKDSWQTF